MKKNNIMMKFTNGFMLYVFPIVISLTFASYLGFTNIFLICLGFAEIIFTFNYEKHFKTLKKLNEVPKND